MVRSNQIIVAGNGEVIKMDTSLDFLKDNGFQCSSCKDWFDKREYKECFDDNENSYCSTCFYELCEKYGDKAETALATE